MLSLLCESLFYPIHTNCKLIRFLLLTDLTCIIHYMDFTHISSVLFNHHDCLLFSFSLSIWFVRSQYFYTCFLFSCSLFSLFPSCLVSCYHDFVSSLRILFFFKCTSQICNFFCCMLHIYTIRLLLDPLPSSPPHIRTRQIT